MSAELVQALRLRSRQLTEAATAMMGTHDNPPAAMNPCEICHQNLLSQVQGTGKTVWYHETEPADKHQAVPLDYYELRRKAEQNNWLAHEYLTLASLVQGSGA